MIPVSPFQSSLTLQAFNIKLVGGYTVSPIETVCLTSNICLPKPAFSVETIINSLPNLDIECPNHDLYLLYEKKGKVIDVELCDTDCNYLQSHSIILKTDLHCSNMTDGDAAIGGMLSALAFEASETLEKKQIQDTIDTMRRQDLVRWAGECYKNVSKLLNLSSIGVTYLQNGLFWVVFPSIERVFDCMEGLHNHVFPGVLQWIYLSRKF